MYNPWVKELHYSQTPGTFTKIARLAIKIKICEESVHFYSFCTR